MGFTPSPQQREIWDCVRDEQCHVEIDALAGTGKTTTIVEALKMLPFGGKYAFVAFNKSIATELSTRVPKGVQALTLHSLGFACIKQAWGYAKVDADKTLKMLPEEMPWHTKTAVMKLVSICKGMLVDTNDTEALHDIVERYDIDTNGDTLEVFDVVRDIIARSAQRSNIIDFDDMIWLPIVLSLPTPKLDVIMVDECQDLNRAQQELVMRSAKRIIMVGDRKQAIYGFRGADVDAMNNMESTLSATDRGLKVFPLTVTRRCPKTVTALAATIVPNFECDPSVIDGEVITESTVEMLRGDMALCRTNAPLIRQAYSLIRSNTPVKIQGRDFGKSLATFIRRLARKESSTAELLRKLEQYVIRESAKINEAYKGKRAESRLQSLEDKQECIDALCEGMDTVEDVLNRISTLFGDVESGQDASRFVLLSSVHRAKGLEADRVHIMHYELMPHPMAKQPWQQQQEMNLKYVAITRSKQSLFLRNGN